MRGQTTLDFTIGIAIFIGVLLFVFTFVPGILEPFDVAGEEEPALSDRIANTISQGMLGSPQEPHVLDRYCTVEFFNGTSPSRCNYGGTTLEDRFDLSVTQNVNVTIEGNVTGTDIQQLCWTGSETEPKLVEKGHTDCDPSNSEDVVLTIGDNPPTASTTITARRIVTLSDEPVKIEVVVW